MPAQVLVDPSTGPKVRWVPVVRRLVLRAQVDQDGRARGKGRSRGCEDPGSWPFSSAAPIPQWGPGASLYLMASTPQLPWAVPPPSPLMVPSRVSFLCCLKHGRLARPCALPFKRLISVVLQQRPVRWRFVIPFACEEAKVQKNLVTCPRPHSSEKALWASGILHQIPCMSKCMGWGPGGEARPHVCRGSPLTGPPAITPELPDLLSSTCLVAGPHHELSPQALADSREWPEESGEDPSASMC